MEALAKWKSNEIANLKYASTDDSEHCHDDDDAAWVVSADSTIPLL